MSSSQAILKVSSEKDPYKVHHTLYSDGDYTTVLPGNDVSICVITKRHMCQLDTAFYPIANIA